MVVAHPEVVDNWVTLFCWTGAVLQVPRRAGKRHNVSSVVKDRIASFSVSSALVNAAEFNDAPRCRKALSAAAVLLQAVAAKLEDESVKAAIRILTSEKTVAIPSERTVALLKEEHPAAAALSVTLPSQSQFSSLSITDADVSNPGLTFPVESAGGPVEL
jgi:hypothetical protein